MLLQEEREKIAEMLKVALESRKQCERPSDLFPNIEIADSYAISSMIADAKVKEGRKIIGHKIGLTSKAMQAASQIDEPDYGYILDDQLLETGVILNFEDYCRPRVEPELTFVLKEPLKGPGVGILDVMRATEYVVPSIEILDSRIIEPRKIFDTIADNGAAAALIVGGRPMRPDDVDLVRVGAAVFRNSEIEETGLASGVLGHPARAIAWLANKVAAFDETLEAGHMMLSGSFTRPIVASKGDTLHADFGPMGSVSVHFR